MTQFNLAESVGASQSTISAIENGTRNPSVSLLKRLAAALGVTVDELIRKGEG